MTKEEASNIIDAGPERAKYTRMELVSHLQAAPGGISVLRKRDPYHGLNAVTRTPRRENGSYKTGTVRVFFDDDPNADLSHKQVLARVAERIQNGFYSSNRE